MGKDGYYGDFDSLHDERVAYNEYNKFRNEREPNCVPCYGCMNPMYEVSDDPRNNWCDDCLAKKFPPKQGKPKSTEKTNG
jgi:hypothetical protein